MGEDMNQSVKRLRRTTSPSNEHNPLKICRSVRTAPLAVDTDWCCAPCVSPLAFNKNIKKINTRTDYLSKRSAHSKPSSQSSMTVHNKHMSLRFNDTETGDVKLCLRGKNDISVNLTLHRCVLVASSGLFKRRLYAENANNVEITECGDLEMFVETLKLMYLSYLRLQSQLKRRVSHQVVLKVLRILQVSITVEFEEGVEICLEHLEKVPWNEEEEQILISLMKHHKLKNGSTRSCSTVLSRIYSLENASVNNTENNNSSSIGEILPGMLDLVMKGENLKAKKDMKMMVMKLLKSNPNEDQAAETALYIATRSCMAELRESMVVASVTPVGPTWDKVGPTGIARNADNLQWLFDMLAEMRGAEEFVTMWAREAELVELHGHVAVMVRHEVSRVTSAIFVAIGKGHLAVDVETRVQFVLTWLKPLLDDYVWLLRACKGVIDMKSVEEAMSNTILTLPMSIQESILSTWLHHYLQNSIDSPNLSRAFEAWWKRTSSKTLSLV